MHERCRERCSQDADEAKRERFQVSKCVGAKGRVLRVITYSGGELSQNIYVKG